MAMMYCPECGQRISDKANKCIHCGKVFAEEEVIQEEIKCGECGYILADSDEECPNCGCPIVRVVNEEDSISQQEEAARRKTEKKKKKIIIGVIVALVLCVGFGIVFKVYSEHKAKLAYRESYNQYIVFLERAKLMMVSGGSDAETLCNLTAKVWKNAIYEDSDYETNKYTKPNGYFVYDFNTALKNLYDDTETQETVSDIRSSQGLVKDLIKKMQDPPKDLEKCYDTVTELYESYKVITDMAISPTGSYNDFTSKVNDEISEFMTAYEKLDNQIPEKMEDK